MPETKNNKNKKSDSDKENVVEIKENNKSSVSEFIKRPVPSQEEVEEFNEAIEDEVREDEIEESLTEIYQNEAGDKVNVKKLDIKKRQGLGFWLLRLVFTMAVLLGIGYGVYYFIFQSGSDATAIEFSIIGEENITAGEEFFYLIKYENNSNVLIKDIRVELNYPENYVFLDSSPLGEEYKYKNDAGEEETKRRNNVFLMGSLAPRGQGEIKIKGKLVDEKDSENIIIAKITYMPENFSSEFKKEISLVTTIKAIGIDFDLEYSSAVLVGEDNAILVNVKTEEDNFLNTIRLSIETPENLEIISVAPELKAEEEAEQQFRVENIKGHIWEISGFNEDPKIDDQLEIKYKFTDKKEPKENINLMFFTFEDDQKERQFFEKVLEVEVMKSDLNLTMIINGSANDKGVNFGDILNYSIAYVNKGETSMKDIVIMAVLESDFLDWSTLDNNFESRAKGNTITWSEAEIENLHELEVGEEGIIDFSIKVKDFSESDLGKNFQVKSYAQYSISNIEEVTDGEDEEIDNRSNTIINKINSDLTLRGEVRYFSADNIPVGNGPIPPKVGETTSFKVYWTLTNNLHELREAQVLVKLPDYVKWDNKNRTSVGTIKYDASNREVIWQIGRLPITVYRADAEFNISITPTESDKNKIMVLLPGAIITATDSETQEIISQTINAKTTKLEDDEIANMSRDGRVE